jgi:hypothetical protein
MTTPHTKNDDDDRALKQAQSQINGIREMVAELRAAQDSGDDGRVDAAQTAIFEDPLSVEVRTSWHPVGEARKPDEFYILLCTGGPAVRITGDLSEYGEAENVRVESQDWFTHWEDACMTAEEQADVLTYCHQFYFGE